MDIYEYMNVAENEKPLDRIVENGGFCAIFRTIACIGDSLSSGEFESLNADGTKRYHDFFEYSWGQFIARDCGSKVYNFSCGGMTAQEYVTNFANNRNYWDRNKVAQAYIIALGVNDVLNQGKAIGSVSDICKEDHTKNADTFAGYYGQIIQRIKQIQPRAKIFLVSMPKSGDANDEKRRQVRDLLAEMTKFFNRTYLIDLFEYAPVNDAAYHNKFWLGHLTPAGYVLTAKMIESYIDYIIRKNPKDFAQVGFIGSELYYAPEEE